MMEPCGGAEETVREQHHRVKHTRQTITNNSSWSEEKLVLDFMRML